VLVARVEESARAGLQAESDHGAGRGERAAEAAYAGCGPYVVRKLDLAVGPLFGDVGYVA
jgi:hypothetical protein